jgi:kumamolisin
MTQFVPLPGSRRSLMPNSRPAGPVDLAETASLTLRLRSRGDLRALEEKVRAQSEKPLSERTYATRDELAASHGARAEDFDLVEKFAQDHDLVVVHRDTAKRTLVVQGKLKNLLVAFPADVRLYHHATGPYRGRRGDIKIPQDLSEIITGVFGFDTRPRHRSPHRRAGGRPDAAQNNGVVATEFAKRYKFPTEYQGARVDGSGQTIAIIELGGGFRQSDLKAFFKEANIALPKVTAVSVDRAHKDPSNAQSDDGEVMLDLEVACAVAPKAKYVVYFAPNNGDKGFIDAFAAAIHDKERKPDVISVSWGGPEAASDKQGIDAFHELFVDAAALGLTICVASGDHGAADETIDVWDGKIHVDHPACDDLVLGCGGTQINGNADVAWNDGTSLEEGGWATGGGVSAIFSVPSYQQRYAKIPPSIATGKVGRGVPDIAMSATNYLTRVDGLEGPSGGTSAVAPLMSALVALLNQAKKKNVGFLNTFLYANASKVVVDVVHGSNVIDGKGYQAGPGWDACTGLGTPDGTAILNHL